MRPDRRHPLSGIRFAQEGVVHCFRTQPHMRFHFYMATAVLASGLLLNVGTTDMLVLTFSIALVMCMEMVNTAVEAVVDMITEIYSPAAKLAKDVAAGAVLVAALNALVNGALVFFGPRKLGSIQGRMQADLPVDVTRVVVVGLVVVTLIVVIAKILSNTGPWRGGVISGHSAVGFLLAMTIYFNVGNTVLAVIALVLAGLIAQSRIDAGIHSLREVVLGAVLAILFTALVFRVAPTVRGAMAHPPHGPVQPARGH